MSLMTIMLGLSLLGGPMRTIPRLDTNNQQEVKSFCEVMTAPKLFQGKRITLKANALVLYGGALINSDDCQLPDVSLHYWKDFERASNAEAMESLHRVERRAREVYERGDEGKGQRTRVNVVLEGELEKNPFYHARWDRGAATFAAWDAQQEYSFVVSRVVSLREPQQ